MNLSGRWAYWLLLVVLVTAGVVMRKAYLMQATWPDMPKLAGYVPPTPTTEPSPTPKLLCDVLVTADLEALVQESLVGPKSRIDHEEGIIQSQTCFWSAASGAYTPTIAVSLSNAETVIPNVTKISTGSAELSSPPVATDSALISSTKTIWQTEQAKNQTRPGYREIDGLGATAYVSPTGLYVLFEGKMIRVFVSLTDREQVQSLMEQIARQVLTSLAM